MAAALVSPLIPVCLDGAPAVHSLTIHKAELVAAMDLDSEDDAPLASHSPSRLFIGGNSYRPIHSRLKMFFASSPKGSVPPHPPIPPPRSLQSTCLFHTASSNLSALALYHQLRLSQTYAPDSLARQAQVTTQSDCRTCPKLVSSSLDKKMPYTTRDNGPPSWSQGSDKALSWTAVGPGAVGGAPGAVVSSLGQRVVPVDLSSELLSTAVPLPS